MSSITPQQPNPINSTEIRPDRSKEIIKKRTPFSAAKNLFKNLAEIFKAKPPKAKTSTAKLSTEEESVSKTGVLGEKLLSVPAQRTNSILAKDLPMNGAISAENSPYQVNDPKLKNLMDRYSQLYQSSKDKPTDEKLKPLKRELEGYFIDKQLESAKGLELVGIYIKLDLRKIELEERILDLNESLKQSSSHMKTAKKVDLPHLMAHHNMLKSASDALIGTHKEWLIEQRQAAADLNVWLSSVK